MYHSYACMLLLQEHTTPTAPSPAATATSTATTSAALPTQSGTTKAPRRQRSSRASDTSTCISSTSSSKLRRPSQAVSAQDATDSATVSSGTTAAAAATAAAATAAASSASAALVSADTEREQTAVHPGSSSGESHEVEAAELSRLHAQLLDLIPAAFARRNNTVEPVDVPRSVLGYVIGRHAARLQRVQDDHEVLIHQPDRGRANPLRDVERLYVEAVSEQQAQSAVAAIRDIVDRSLRQRAREAALALHRGASLQQPQQHQPAAVPAVAAVTNDTAVATGGAGSGATTAATGATTAASGATGVHSGSTERPARRRIAGVAYGGSDSDSVARAEQKVLQRLQQQQQQSDSVAAVSSSTSSNSGNAASSAVSRPANTPAADEMITAEVAVPRAHRELLRDTLPSAVEEMQQRYGVTNGLIVGFRADAPIVVRVVGSAASVRDCVAAILRLLQQARVPKSAVTVTEASAAAAALQQQQQQPKQRQQQQQQQQQQRQSVAALSSTDSSTDGNTTADAVSAPADTPAAVDSITSVVTVPVAHRLLLVGEDARTAKHMRARYSVTYSANVRGTSVRAHVIGTAADVRECVAAMLELLKQGGVPDSEITVTEAPTAAAGLQQQQRHRQRLSETAAALSSTDSSAGSLAVSRPADAAAADDTISATVFVPREYFGLVLGETGGSKARHMRKHYNVEYNLISRGAVRDSKYGNLLVRGAAASVRAVLGLLEQAGLPMASAVT
jgi:trimeric autotransporter adhesin